MRSLTWFRLISEVPPAIDMPRCMSTSTPGRNRTCDTRFKKGPQAVQPVLANPSNPVE